MPRKSYEAFRAGKAYSAGRRSSLNESETDAESTTSYSTHHSSSSYQTQTNPLPPRLAPYSSTLSPNPNPRLRTFSSSSSNHTNNHISNPNPPSSNLTIPSSHAHSPSSTTSSSKLRKSPRNTPSTLRNETYNTPLRRYLRYLSQSSLSQWSLPLGLLGVGIIKVGVGFGGFSGKDAPPMFGDFEAQRHWCEVMVGKGWGEWYTYREDWWLLDYPPLTAYVSWLCGYVGSKFNPEWFALDTSHGKSPEGLITYMRSTVLVLEMLVWWSAVIAWCIVEGRQNGRSWRTQVTGILTVLLQPSLMLIDNGHFQYNSVLLGFSLWTVLLLRLNHDLLACVAFSLALGFKQMGLYYAPAIGCYLLGKCIWLGGIDGLIHLTKLGVVTITTFTMLYLPWLRPFSSAIQQVIHRMFPFARGIFEDKVANFWCASNVVLKWRRWFGVAGMARLATVATLVSLLPVITILLYSSYTTRRHSDTVHERRPASMPSSNDLSSPPTSSSTKIHTVIPKINPPKPDHQPNVPTATLLLPSLLLSSLSFFLFSFQVHEKSFLLPLMPLTMMMITRGSGSGGDEDWEVGVLINNVAAFSMWPLLKRDGQVLQYFTVTFLWNYVIGYSPIAVKGKIIRRVGYVVYPVLLVVQLLDVWRPPGRYPDLWVVLNVLVSFVVFAGLLLWSLKRLVEGAWGIGGLGSKAGRGKRKVQ